MFRSLTQTHPLCSFFRFRIVRRHVCVHRSRVTFMSEQTVDDVDLSGRLQDLSVSSPIKSDAPPAADKKAGIGANQLDHGVNLAVYYHPICSQHRIPDHPECYQRVDSILAALRQKWDKTLTYVESKPVTKDQILLFHTPELLKRFCKLAENVLLTYTKKKSVIYANIDSDTAVMWQTRPAAFYAAGSVICALDSMYAPLNSNTRIDTAFCCVRPPGHHAERDKSGGFCFFNNVAIGARYAQRTHGVERVAILDFDVHHGNGTEEGFTDDPTVFYGSTHGRDHYPGTGHDPSPLVGDRAVREVDRRIVNRTLTPGPKSRPEFFVKWREILSEMERFQPQLVIMSTGFDAHDDDPLADCELQDEDYHWVTAEILASCGRVQAELGQPVRYLSVLEGGYDIPAIQRSAVCHVRALLEGIPQVHKVAGASAGADAGAGKGEAVVEERADVQAKAAHTTDAAAEAAAAEAQFASGDNAADAPGEQGVPSEQKVGDAVLSVSDSKLDDEAMQPVDTNLAPAVDSTTREQRMDGELAALMEYLQDKGISLKESEKTAEDPRKL